MEKIMEDLSARPLTDGDLDRCLEEYAECERLEREYTEALERLVLALREVSDA